MHLFQRVFIIILVISGINACGKGVNGTAEISTLCDFGELYSSKGTCIDSKVVDIDGDGVEDGLDLNNDGLPDIIFSEKAVSEGNGSSITAEIDIDNDGTSDYFLIQEQEKYAIYDNKAGTGDNIFIVLDEAGEFKGFDINRDGVVDENSKLFSAILADEVAPTITADKTSGFYPIAQNVTLSCSDDVQCMAIVYTLDGSDPSFALTNFETKKIILGESATASLGDGGNGEYQIKFMARDANGNQSEIQSLTITVDSSTPTVSINLASGNFSSNQVVAITCTDNQACSQIAYSLDGTTPDFISSTIVEGDTAEITLGEDGDKNYQLKFLARDITGLQTAVETANYIIDKNAPTSSINKKNGLLSSDKTVVISCADAVACNGIAYTTDGSDPSFSGGGSQIASGANTTISFDSSGDGILTLKYRSRDSVGNIEAIKEATFTIDETAPFSTVIDVATTTLFTSGIYLEDKSVKISCSDDIACTSIIYTLDGSDPDFATSLNVVEGNEVELSIGALGTGSRELKFKGQDSAGNIEATQTIAFDLDLLAPISQLDRQDRKFTSGQSINIVCQDDLLCTNIVYTTNGEDPIFSQVINDVPIKGNGTEANSNVAPLDLGTAGSEIVTLKFRAKDSAGRIEDIQTIELTFDNTPPVTIAQDDKGIPIPATGNYSGITSVELECADVHSSCESISYELERETTGDPEPISSGLVAGNLANISVGIEGSGTYNLTFNSVDELQNTEASSEITFVVDNEAPVTISDGVSGYYPPGKVVTLSCTDDTDPTCDNIKYTITYNGAADAEANGNSITLDTEGTYSISYYATDNAKNIEEAKTQTYYIDDTSPTVTSSHGSGSLVGNTIVTLTCSDDFACDEIAYAISYTFDDSSVDFLTDTVVSGNTANIAIDNLGDGSVYLKYAALDRAGNRYDSTSTLLFTFGCGHAPNAVAHTASTITTQRSSSSEALSQFTLMGSGSVVDKGFAYKWEQIVQGDEPIDTTLESSLTSNPSNSASLDLAIDIPAYVTTLKYRLSVVDNSECTASDTVVIYVIGDNPPIFVDGNNVASGDGSRDSPYTSIQTAIENAAGKDIYVATLTEENSFYNEKSAILSIPAGTSVYGGFNSNWVRNVHGLDADNSNRTIIHGYHNPSVLFSNVSGNTWFDGFKLLAEDSSASEKSAGVVASNGSGNLYIQNSEIRAGNVESTSSTNAKSSYGVLARNITKLISFNNSIYSGKGGFGSIGTSPSVPSKAANGGNGSKGTDHGGTIDAENNGGTGSGDGGDGGTGWVFATGGIAQQGSYSTDSCITLGGTYLSKGKAGVDADSVGVTSSGGIGIGTSSTTNYDPADGINGGNGEIGCAGGGGSGGFGGYHHFNSKFHFLSGGGGGGGGAGGVGGIGGGKGYGGGASIALFVQNISSTTLEKTQLQSLNGGNGGTGGDGSNGSAGGNGGSGGSGSSDDGNGGAGTYTLSKPGFEGGNGGKGAKGGDGSGGGGGPSIALFISSNNTEVEFIESDNVLTAGNAGLGGSGGAATSPTSDGEDGYSYAVYDPNGKLATASLGSNSLSGNDGEIYP